MNNVIIMADGTGSRWNHPEVRYKQLIKLSYTTIIERTIAQVSKYPVNITLIAPEEFDKIIHITVARISLGYRPTETRTLLDGILKTKQLWTEKTYILLGDVIYSNAAIDQIFTCELDTWILGRIGANKVTGKTASELFSFVFNPEKENIAYNLQSLLQNNIAGKLWNYYQKYKPPIIQTDDYTDDVDSP
jgi:choline kinase